MPGAAPPPGRIIYRGSCWASELPPRRSLVHQQEREAALGHVLAVPGQLLTTTAPPADTPAPPTVIPAAKRTYAEAAATPALDGATHVYMQCVGVGPPLAINYAGPYLMLEKGPKVFKLQIGTREDVITRDRLKPHLGQAPPVAADPPRRGRPPGRRD